MKRSSGTRKRHGVRRWCGRILLLTLCTLCALLFLGIPAPVLQPILDLGSPPGLPIEASRLRYQPGSGWILENPRVFSARDRVTPWFRAETLRMDVDHVHAVRTGKIQGAFVLTGGTLETNLGFWADDLLTDQPLLVSEIDVDGQVTPDRISLSRARGEFGDFRFHLKGELDPTLFGRSEADETGEGLSQTARLWAPIVEHLEDFRFVQKARVDIQLRPGEDASAPVRAEVKLSHQGGARHRGFSFRDLAAEAAYAQGVLDVTSLHIRETEDRYLLAEGRFDFRNERLNFVIENTLKRYALEALSPYPIHDLLEDLDVRVEGEARFRLEIPETRFDAFGENLTADFELEEAFYRDTFFPEISLRLQLEDRQLRLSHIDGTLGKGKGQGPIRGDLELSLDGSAVDLDLTGGFNPDEIISLVGPNVERMIREWEFRGEPPTIELDYTQTDADSPPSLFLKLQGKDVLCRGTALQQAQIEVVMNDREIRLQEMQASRGTHTLKGEVIIAADFSRLDLDLMSTFPLPDLAPFIGDWMEEGIRDLRFDGSSWLQVAGRVDLSGGNDHRIQGKCVLNQVTWSWVRFRNISSSFSLTPEGLVLPEFKGRLVEGEVEGHLEILDLFGEDSASFTLKLDVEKADLFKVITAATDTLDTPYKGKLNLDLALKGKLPSRDGTPWVPSLNGKGGIEIKEGSLFRIPLLLGLSRILSAVVKDFGYASQTDFTAEYTLEDGVIKSDNLFLKGNLLSVAGDGSYQIGEDIHANLKVQLFNTGILSEALKVVLWPIRKLIEIQLTGTLENPDWQPRNLPKELFGK